MLVGIILFILLCYLVGHLVGPSKKQLLKDSQRKYEKLENELEQLKQDFYFDMRNKQLEIEMLKNQLKEDKIEIHCGGR